MSQVFLFAGTTEGRRLARRLGAAGIETTVSVATEYGALVLEEAALGDTVQVLHGRMDRDGMTAAIRKEDPEIVVDATHPYAVEASDNIRAAAEKAGVSYLRLKRKTKDSPDRKVLRFGEVDQVIPALQRTTGNILLTTGVNTLARFAGAEGIRDRLYVRVLPGEESLKKCEEAGIRGRQIIAMQGPFSQEMNRATIHAYDIRHLVTKQSGASGGFAEKFLAAQETETALYIVGAPEEDGVPYAEVLDRLGELLSVDLRDTVTITVSLVGMGPGHGGYLTEKAKQSIRDAEVIFGAERLIKPYQAEKKAYPYYRGEEILPRLENLLQEARQGDPHVRVAVLLSGDSGFYSGASGLIFYLTNWRRRMLLSDTGKFEMQIHTVPGISSVAFLASRLQDHWDSAYVASLHGQNEDTWKEVLRHLSYEKRSYLLTSGKEDVERLLAWIRNEEEQEKYSMYAGYQMSYPEEMIFAEEGERPGLGAEDAKRVPFPDILPEGLYTVMIRNDAPGIPPEKRERQALAGLSNDEYLQERGVPITKEEIRTIALGKLRVKEPAVIYDIGSGSGSFATELGRILVNTEIYAIEKEPARAELVRRNLKHLAAESVTVVEGEAPEAFRDLPAPTHVIIGGSDGNLFLILSELFRKSVNARVVIPAVTLETKTELAQLLSGTVSTEYTIQDAEYVEVNISRNRKLGRYQSLAAENPVAILSFQFGRRPGA